MYFCHIALTACGAIIYIILISIFVWKQTYARFKNLNTLDNMVPLEFLWSK